MALKIPVVLGVFFFAGESGFDFGLGFAADFLVPPAVTVVKLLEEESREEVAAARDAGARSDLHPLKTLAATEDISRYFLRVSLCFLSLVQNSVCVCVCVCLILENLCKKVFGEKGLTFDSSTCRFLKYETCFLDTKDLNFQIYQGKVLNFLSSHHLSCLIDWNEYLYGSDVNGSWKRQWVGLRKSMVAIHLLQPSPLYV